MLFPIHWADVRELCGSALSGPGLTEAWSVCAGPVVIFPPFLHYSPWGDQGEALSLSPCPPFEMIFALHRSTFRLTQRQRTLHTCASLESLAILNINASIISVVPKELRSAGPQSSVSYVFFPMAKRLSKSIVRRAVKQLSCRDNCSTLWFYLENV